MHHELYAFNLNEHVLRTRFIDPYELGQPITWLGRTLPAGDIEHLHVRETEEPIDEDSVRSAYREFEAFESGTDVTNDWIVTAPGGRQSQAPPGDEAPGRVLELCRRFGAVVRQLQPYRSWLPSAASAPFQSRG